VIGLLRVHFTLEDLARVRLAKGPEPMWEVLLSLHKLGDGDGQLVFDEWRRHVRARLPVEADWLLGLAPPRGYSPDFLTPAAGSGDLEQALRKVLATPRHRISAELASLRQPLDKTARALADGHTDALRHLGTAIRDYYRVSLAPYWPQISVAVHADLALRAGDLACEGIGKLLAGLHPQARWRPPVLEIPFPVDRDLHPAGRGLRLVPSFFCWGQPITLKDPDLPPVLVYPIEHDLAWARRNPGTPVPRPLAALIGRTRLSVLTIIADSCCTTTQIAQRAGVSIASASQHAAILRDAGLITTTRHGSCVIHTVTPAAATFITRSRQQPA
jgi:DNA-binding transcriptional ArsR family regulator